MNKLERELRVDISSALKTFTDDYSGTLENELMDNIVSDVIECSDYENGQYSSGDIALAIGRVLCTRLNIDI